MALSKNSKSMAQAATHLHQCIELLDVLTHVGVLMNELLVGLEVHHIHRIEPATELLLRKHVDT
jgi:hypothetical protein